MTYDELIAQLAWTPRAEGAPAAKMPRAVVGGMGGSGLPAHAVRFLDNAVPVVGHRDYGLPEGASTDALYIAISYSGNTVETLSFAEAAHEKGFPLAVVASGGKLVDFARSISAPLIVVPGGVPPRDALFFLSRALLAHLGDSALQGALAQVSFDRAAAEAEGAALAESLAGALPVFYASRKNGFLAAMAKISFNETAKMPAFSNVFPELNHNEMQSFDTPAPEAVAALARFVLLRDTNDDPRIVQRMDVFTDVMRSRGRTVQEVSLGGGARAATLVRGWYVTYLAALALARSRNIDPDGVPLIEDFKRRL